MDKETNGLRFEQYVAIARTQNATSNGRLFCAMMFVLVLFIAFQIDGGALWLAFFPVLAVGAAYLQDSHHGHLGRALPLISTIAAIVPLLSILYI
ncbi:hypothetical protein [Agrobacterium tumefaciens]|uniref:hypothetical protein n=1 Tax=Agrobacterium tumefaciens TaxID=358 RepID=UPI000459952E|nr:hypothetical protein [Agrobacterium tumefaciens]CDN96079.1 hypothetical protein BN949_05254 [Agrobacterium tumefaciens]